MSLAQWEAYIRRGVRLTFALQYFLNRAALGHVRRYVDCATALGAHWHLVVHEDDGDPAHVAEWQHTLASLGTNATLLISQNVHELRGYNRAARMRDADRSKLLSPFSTLAEIEPSPADWARKASRDTYPSCAAL